MNEKPLPSQPKSLRGLLFAIFLGIVLVTPCCGASGWLLTTLGGGGYAKLTDSEVVLALISGVGNGAIGGTIVWFVWRQLSK